MLELRTRVIKVQRFCRIRSRKSQKPNNKQIWLVYEHIPKEHRDKTAVNVVLYLVRNINGHGGKLFDV